MAAKPNTNCVDCKKPFYAAPSHLAKGWGKYCSMKCASENRKGNKNPRFIDAPVNCKFCGESFQVKPSAKRNGHGRTYCSDDCRRTDLQKTITCQWCEKDFRVWKSQASRRKFCSKSCQEKSQKPKPNCVCATCGSNFFAKPSELKRGRGAGTYCSASCMTGSRRRRRVDGVVTSHLEEAMLLQIKAMKLTDGMKREFEFHPTRKWRFDFAWPELKLAVEVQGGIWLGKSGAHTSGKGRARDCEKLNEAVLMGWRVLQFTSSHIKSGMAIDMLTEALR